MKNISVVMCFLGVMMFVEFLLVYAHGSNLVHNKQDGAVEGCVLLSYFSIYIGELVFVRSSIYSYVCFSAAIDLDATTDLRGRRLDQVMRDGDIGRKNFDFAGGVESHDGGHGSSSGGGKGQRGGGEQTVRPKNDERSGAISHVLEQLVHVGVGLLLLAFTIV